MNISELKTHFQTSYFSWLIYPRALYDVMGNQQETLDPYVAMGEICHAFETVSPWRRWLFSASLGRFYASDENQRYLMLPRTLRDSACLDTYLSMLSRTDNPNDMIDKLTLFEEYDKSPFFHTLLRQLTHQSISPDWDKIQIILEYLDAPDAQYNLEALLDQLINSMKKPRYFEPANYKDYLDFMYQFNQLDCKKELPEWLLNRMYPLTIFTRTNDLSVDYYRAKREYPIFFNIIEALRRNQLLFLLSAPSIEKDLTAIMTLFRLRNAAMQRAFDRLAEDNVLTSENFSREKAFAVFP